MLENNRKEFQQRQQMENAMWLELCSHLEHAPDHRLLSDHTAALLLSQPEQRQLDGLEMLRNQLFSRHLAGGRVDSWFPDCVVRYNRDRKSFLDHALEEETAAQQEAEKQLPRIRPASQFAPETAEYLVSPYLPRGMVSILGGVSGAGKTSLALDLCARLTVGKSLPFAPEPDAPAAPCRVLYLTAENDPNKVLRPRAEAMGADLDRLYFQDGASYAMGDPALYQVLRQLRPGLVVFDPIQSYLGQGIQMNRAEQVRPLLDGLGALAKELDMAVLLISHMSKPGPGVSSALDRLLGSSDFRNAARSILIVGRDPDQPDTRVFAHAKNSLGVPGESQRYRITPEGTVCYTGSCELSADSIIQQSQPASGRGRPAAGITAAVEALQQQLSFVGWVETGEVYRLCAREGFSVPTMRRAREALDLKVLRTGKPPNRRTFWHRSDVSPDAVLADYTNQNEQLTVSDP